LSEELRDLRGELDTQRDDEPGQLPSSRAPTSTDIDDTPVVITAMGNEPEPVPVGRVVGIHLGPSLLKVAAFSYAVRHAFNEETRTRARITMRRELKRQRRLHRKAHRASRQRASGHAERGES
jgi:hypothetical protein